eukprot:g13153.t1
MCGLSKWRREGLTGALRELLRDAVLSNQLLGYVRSLQTHCGVSPDGAPANAALHALFTGASAFGDEAFYTVALPLSAWMLDLQLSRRLAFFWASTYYVGQSTKEVFRLPRPPPPVVRLEHRYSAEYGLPSTHTMGSLIPLFLVAAHYSVNGSGGARSIPPALLWSCLAWSAVIATSRLYMGVHSIPDVLTGYLLGGCLLGFWLTFGGGVDAFIVGNPAAWLAVLGGAVCAILAYPLPDRWTNSFGDTALIVATAAGFLEACCLSQGEDDSATKVLEGVHLLSSGRAEGYGWPALSGDARRCGVGFLVLLPMRFTLKFCCRGLLSAVLAKSPNWPKTKMIRRHVVDIPSKVVVYGCMGFCSFFIVPRLWLWLGLERKCNVGRHQVGAFIRISRVVSAAHHQYFVCRDVRMATTRKVVSAAATFLFLPGICHGQQEVTTCEELQAAFELTKTQDVNVVIHPFADIECATYTNMTMSSNTLNVSSSENLDNYSGNGKLRRVRFEVTNGAKLFWETNVLFDGVEGEEEQLNDGGAVYVGEGSTVRFYNDVEMTDVSIINETKEDSDFASFLRSGGCVWTNGYFRVDGVAILTRCDITGAGESPPGPGGAVYVGEKGSVLFNEGVIITETTITDDFGGKGGAIYNLGKVNIKGSARFEDLRASSGGAIYNGENAIFNFRKGATALFRDVSNRDADGSAVFNVGFFKFSGPALFVNAEPPAIVAAAGSETILSKDSAFYELGYPGETQHPDDVAISLSDSAVVTIPSSVIFVGVTGPEL